MKMPAIVVALLLVGALAPETASASDQQVRKYAVMSLIGDRILVVGSRQKTGSNLDQHVREYHPLGGDELDRAALLYANQALKVLDPGSEPTLLAVRDPGLYALQEQSLDTDSAAKALMESLRPIAANAKVTHLLLITKYRAEISVPSGGGVGYYAGEGKVDGLGFYVDRRTLTHRLDTFESAMGFMAPFAYLKVSLIDVATMSVVREEVAKESVLTGTAGKESVHPWDALSGTDKVRALQTVMRKGLMQAVPRAVR